MTKDNKQTDVTIQEKGNTMKEKVMTYWNKNKAQCGVVAGVMVLVLAGGGIAIASNNLNPVDTLSGVNNTYTPNEANKDTQTASNDTVNATDANTEDTQTLDNVEVVSETTNDDGTVTKTLKDGSTVKVNKDGSTIVTSSNNTQSTSSNTDTSNNNASSAHNHSWTPIYKTVHHDAVTEQREEPKYEWTTVCTDCGQVLPSREHSKAHVMNYQSGGTRQENVLVGTQLITYTLKAAYDEEVLDHYSCTCGATK